MAKWKKYALIGAGVGGGVAVLMAVMAAGWIWYRSRPPKTKPWDAKAIIATFDYPDTESDEPSQPNGERSADTIVLYYTFQNTTDVDYRLPPQEQLELDGRLKRENSLSDTNGLVTLDKEQAFIPSKQRRQVAVHLKYAVTELLGPEPKTKEDHRKRWKLLAEYMKKELPNLDGFTLFDSATRYQVNLPNGWDSINLK